MKRVNLFWTLGLMALGFQWSCGSNNPPSSPAPVPTATFTPSPLPTFTSTSTPTTTQTGTPTRTATVTPTFTITNSYTPTYSFTPTCSYTPTNTPTVTATVTWTGTPTFTGTPAFTFVTKWATNNGQSIAVDSIHDRVIVGTGYKNCLQMFTRSGTPVATLCASGSGPGQFATIGGVAVDQSGTIYVADWGNNRVQLFDLSLNQIGQWGNSAPAPGSSLGDFNVPYGVALDNGGAAGATVYVIDTGNHRVEKFTTSGTPVAQWAVYPTPDTSGLPPPQFGRLAIDLSNDVFTTAIDPRLFKYTSDGMAVTAWKAPGNYADPNWLNPLNRGLATDASGNILVACGDGNFPRAALRKFDSSGNLVGDIAIMPLAGGFESIPSDVAVDDSGMVYMADYSGFVYVFSQ